MAIASPYTTSIKVAHLLPVPLKMGTDFTAETTPTKTAVDAFIGWVSSQMELQFSMAGYALPFADVESETWPSHQTTYLQMVASLGAAALAGGHSLKPAPALSPGQQGGTGNLFQDLYNAELKKIYDPQTRQTLVRFRANYYASTPAESALIVPKGPTTDFMQGKYDPMRYLPSYEVADRILAVHSAIAWLYPSWDYLYGIFDINQGLGRTVYEPPYSGY